MQREQHKTFVTILAKDLRTDRFLLPLPTHPTLLLYCLASLALQLSDCVKRSLITVGAARGKKWVLQQHELTNGQTLQPTTCLYSKDQQTCILQDFVKSGAGQYIYIYIGIYIYIYIYIYMSGSLVGSGVFGGVPGSFGKYSEVWGSFLRVQKGLLKYRSVPKV